MFEAAELGSEIDKDTYEAAVPGLRVDLVNAQHDLRSADFPVLVLVAGDDRPAVNQLVHVLHEWMDARYLPVFVFGPLSEEERERPRFWRYWHELPARGEARLFFGAWASNLVADRVRGELDDLAFERLVDHVERFEETLVHDGTLLLKFWLHLPKKGHRKRLKKAEKDPDEAWRLDERDWEIYESYDEALPLAERLVQKTSTADAPWHVVETTDARWRNLTVARTLLAALTARLAVPVREAAPAAPPAAPTPGVARVLDSVDLSASLDRDEYHERLDALQARLSRCTVKAHDRGHSSVLVFEGWDAAGKGGVIRRMTAAMDVRDYRVIPVSAPTPEEKAHHYLWRFWRRLPRAGRVLIFDRSWYGRVLVERVEGFAREDEWRRAYAEIVDFERQLLEHGTTLLKFWLQVDAAEQLRRFEAREQTPYKKYKIGREDYRNRARRDEYTAAADEMVTRTSTDRAPWHLIAADDKRWARVRVLEITCDALEEALRKD